LGLFYLAYGMAQLLQKVGTYFKLRSCVLISFPATPMSHLLEFLCGRDILVYL
jgi:hypothetical protein